MFSTEYLWTLGSGHDVSCTEYMVKKWVKWKKKRMYAYPVPVSASQRFVVSASEGVIMKTQDKR